MGTARVQMLHKALDGPALAGGIAALKQNNHPLAGLFDPCLQFEQFNL